MEINVIVPELHLWIEASCYDRKAAVVAAIQNLKTRHSIRMLEILEKNTNTGRNLHLVRHLRAITFSPKTKQLVELHIRSRGGSREVERYGITLAPEVRYRHSNMLCQITALSKDDPSSATDTFTKLVTTCRNRQYILETKVKGRRAGRLEWSNEASTCCVDMNANLPAFLNVEPLDFVVNIPDRIVYTIVVIAEDGHDTNRLLVAFFD